MGNIPPVLLLVCLYLSASFTLCITHAGNEPTHMRSFLTFSSFCKLITLKKKYDENCWVILFFIFQNLQNEWIHNDGGNNLLLT